MANRPFGTHRERFFVFSLAVLDRNLAVVIVDRLPQGLRGTSPRPIAWFEHYEMDCNKAPLTKLGDKRRSLLDINAAKVSRLFMKSDSDHEINIFTEALKLPPRERDAFLQRSCAGDRDLRGKVE